MERVDTTGFYKMGIVRRALYKTYSILKEVFPFFKTTIHETNDDTDLEPTKMIYFYINCYRQEKNRIKYLRYKSIRILRKYIKTTEINMRYI